MLHGGAFGTGLWQRMRRDNSRLRLRFRQNFCVLGGVVGTAIAVVGTEARAQAVAPPSTAPDAPLVVAPELVQFRNATYPEAANEAQLEGVVLLKLHVNAEGQVVDAQVVAPAGHGFDEAAVEAARRFVFRPATRNGSPVAAKIHYRYRFTLTPVVPTNPADMKAVAKPGELRGLLLAGDPPVAVPFASVRLLAPDGTMASLTTDALGQFVADGLSAGKYAVDVTVAGFATVKVNEEVAAGQATAVKYFLVPKNESAVEVTVRGTALHREVTHYELAREELIRVPGTMGDALHAVEAMPSVARAPAFSGVLIVRGSSPYDSQVFIEGTLVPRVFHYASLSSVVPSEMIESIEFYPSNFSVRYGRSMGGVIEVGLRETNPDGKYHGSAQIDFINARANVEGPVPLLKGWKFMAGLRGTYVDRWLVPVLRSSGSAVTGMPRYADYQMYLERKLPRQGVFRLGYFGANDKFVPIERDPEKWEAPTDSFGHLQALLRIPLSADIRLKASGSIGFLRNTYWDDADAKNTYLAHLGTARVEVSTKTGSVGSVRLGTDLLYAPFNIKAETSAKGEGGVLANEFTDDPQLRRIELSDILFRPAAYAEYEFVPSRLTNLTAGVRADYTYEASQWTYAPRFSGRQALSAGKHSPTLKGGVGLFYQPPQPGSTLPELGTPGLKSERATHFMLGIEQPVGEQITLSVEGFEKELHHLIMTSWDGSGNTTTRNSAKGRVYGVDVLLRYLPGGDFFGWIGYTLSRSTRKRDSDEPSQLYIYDQTHILNVMASYRLGRGWELGGRFRYMSGFLYNAFPGGMVDNSNGDYVPYGTIERKRLAPYHQLDVRIEKTFEYAAFKWSLYMDVINAYNRESPDYATYKYDLSQTKPLSLSLPILPSLGARGEF